MSSPRQRYEPGIPVLVAESNGDPSSTQWRVWCTYEKRYHFHGKVVGGGTKHRAASPFNETGNSIVTRETADRLHRRSRSVSWQRTPVVRDDGSIDVGDDGTSPKSPASIEPKSSAYPESHNQEGDY